MTGGRQLSGGLLIFDLGFLTTKFTPLEVTATSKERGKIRSKEDGECCIDDHVNTPNGEHEEPRREIDKF